MITGKTKLNLIDSHKLLTDEKYLEYDTKAVLFTIDYLSKHSDEVRAIENKILLKKEIYEIFLVYTLGEGLSDNFVTTYLNNLGDEQTRNHSTGEVKKIKKDLQKILDNISEIKDIYFKHYAGMSIKEHFLNDKLKDEKSVFKELGRLEHATERALRYYTPEQGRISSKERQARIKMILELMKLFDRFNLSIGTGATGLFPNYILDLYEIFEITVDYPVQDIRKAKEIFNNEK